MLINPLVSVGSEEMTRATEIQLDRLSYRAKDEFPSSLNSTFQQLYRISVDLDKGGPPGYPETHPSVIQRPKEKAILSRKFKFFR